MVSHPSLATPYCGVNHTPHSAASAHVRHTGQVWAKSGSNEGHFTLDPKKFLVPIWPCLTLGCVTHHTMQPLPVFHIQGEFGLNHRAVTKANLLMMPKYFLVAIWPPFTLE
jgi:hypothetical protein